MADKKKLKTITIERRHATYEYYTLATDHYEKANEYYRTLKELLGIDDDNYEWSDLIFGGENSFDDVLAKEFVVKARRR